MPKSKHDYLKRQAAQIYLNLAHVIAQTHNLHEIFYAQHADLAEALEIVALSCAMSQDLVQKFWQKAWGQEQPRWESWV